MPFYIRKAVSAGPFRFNFSKGGVGVSVGVRGFRIGTGPRGHYIHAGRGGIYYRTALSRAAQRRKVKVADESPIGEGPDRTVDPAGVTMAEVESGDVLEMRDEPFAELLDEVNAKHRQMRMRNLLAWLTILASPVAFFVQGPAVGALVLALGFPAWWVGRWIDSYRRTAVLFYDLDPDVTAAYKDLTEGFDALAECAGKWHVEAGGAVQDLGTWKRNAGATHIVSRKPTSLTYALPKVIRSNVTPPSLGVGRQVIYFMPDVALVEDGSKIGAVSYTDLEVRWQDSVFIEDGRVPSDAKVIGHTWKHPNKSGGPDRRFRNNHQIPMCLYEVIQLSSASGVNEMVEFSKVGAAQAFAMALRALPRLSASARSVQQR